MAKGKTSPSATAKKRLRPPVSRILAMEARGAGHMDHRHPAGAHLLEQRSEELPHDCVRSRDVLDRAIPSRHTLVRALIVCMDDDQRHLGVIELELLGPPALIPFGGNIERVVCIELPVVLHDILLVSSSMVSPSMESPWSGGHRAMRTRSPSVASSGR